LDSASSFSAPLSPVPIEIPRLVLEGIARARHLPSAPACAGACLYLGKKIFNFQGFCLLAARICPVPIQCHEGFTKTDDPGFDFWIASLTTMDGTLAA
jgi:hypothetical protein